MGLIACLKFTLASPFLFTGVCGGWDKRDIMICLRRWWRGCLLHGRRASWWAIIFRLWLMQVIYFARLEFTFAFCHSSLYTSFKCIADIHRFTPPVDEQCQQSSKLLLPFSLQSSCSFCFSFAPSHVMNPSSKGKCECICYQQKLHLYLLLKSRVWNDKNLLSALRLSPNP